MANRPALNIAWFDGESWGAFGDGLGSVLAVAVHNGELYAGGWFSTAGGPNGVGRWAGSHWEGVGQGTSGPVGALLSHDGRLYVGGRFSAAGGLSASNVAVWDGQTWASLSSGLGGGAQPGVFNLAVFDGALIAAGSFTTSGQQAVSNVARWSGNDWQPLGSGVAGRVNAMTQYEGELVLGGEFQSAGGVAVSRVAAWNGNQWRAMGSNPQGIVYDLALHGGDLYAASWYNPGVVKWDGSNWNPVAHGPSARVAGFGSYEGKLLVYGGFEEIGPHRAYHFAALETDRISFIGGGTNDEVLALNSDGETLIAGGKFEYIGGTHASKLARLTSGEWSQFAAPVPGIVKAVARYNGEVYIGGDLFPSGAMRGIARWDGLQWQPVGTGVPGIVNALRVHDGKLLVGGAFVMENGAVSDGICAWDGSSWHPLAGGVEGEVRAIDTFNGEVVIAGGFNWSNMNTPPYRVLRLVARFDGSAWQSFAGGIQGVQQGPAECLAVYNGELYLAGHLNELNDIARWDGTAWQMVGGGVSNAATGVSNIRGMIPIGGRLLISGVFTHAGNTPSQGYAAWDGSSWSDAGPGATLARALVEHQGRLFAGGTTGVHLNSLECPQQCYPNCDQSTAQPLLNVADFTCFLQRFAAGDAYANCDGSTSPPTLNVADFTCFLQRFAAGC